MDADGLNGKVLVRFIGDGTELYPAVAGSVGGALGAILDAPTPRTPRQRSIIRLTALRLVYAALSITRNSEANLTIQ